MLLQLLAAAAAQAANPTPIPDTTVAPVTVTKPRPIVATVRMANDDTAIGQFVHIWPTSAWQGGRSGKVILSCKIDVHGIAEWCKVAKETPENRGFGAAALQLRPLLKLPPASGPDGPHDAVMDLAIDFKAPGIAYEPVGFAGLIMSSASRRTSVPILNVWCPRTIDSVSRYSVTEVVKFAFAAVVGPIC